MGWEIAYYNDAVQETIGAWPAGIRAYYARLTERMCVFGPNLGMPFTGNIGHNLFEIRAKGKEGIGRAFSCTKVEGTIVILHAYIKKSPKTPQRELEVALRRLADIQRQRTGDRDEDS